jgi:hypothetical protein
MLSKIENDIEPETHEAQRSSKNENIEEIKITAGNALTAPRAVVIIVLHTDIARFAVIIVSAAFRVDYFTFHAH